MCYAFTDDMQREPTSTTYETRRSKSNMESEETSHVEDDRRSLARKRSASTTMERSPTKVAKSSVGGEKSREGSVATVSTIESGSAEKEEQEEIIDGLKKRLVESENAFKSMQEKGTEKLKERRAEINELKNCNSELKSRNSDLEIDLAQLEVDFEALKKSRGSGSSKEFTKRLTNNLNKKNETKFTELKTKYQKAIDVLKEKADDAEQEAKNAKAEFVQKEKDMKKHLAELKKELKAEQAAEIKKFKAENSNEVKEKRDLVKMWEKKIQAHEKHTKEAGNEIGELQHEISRLNRFKQTAHAKIREYEDIIRKKDAFRADELNRKDDFAASIGQEYANKTADLEQKLKHEAKRWAKQKQICDELTQQLVAQQKTNFILRNVNDGKVENLKKVMDDMERSRGMGPGGEAAGDEGGASTQHGEVEDKQAEVENSMGGGKGKASEHGLLTDGSETAKARPAGIDAMKILIESCPRSDAVPKTTAMAEKADSIQEKGISASKEAGPAESTKFSTMDQDAATDAVASSKKVDSPMKQFMTPEDVFAAFTNEGEGKGSESEAGAGASMHELDEAAGPESTMGDGAKAGEVSIFGSTNVGEKVASGDETNKDGSGVTHAAVDAGIAAAGGHLSGVQDVKMDGAME